LGIPRLLDGADIAGERKPDEKSVMAYVSLLVSHIRRNRINYANCTRSKKI
jgi:hypothetical protein